MCTYIYMRIYVYTSTYTCIYAYVKINCTAFVNKCHMQRIDMNYTTPGVRRW